MNTRTGIEDSPRTGASGLSLRASAKPGTANIAGQSRRRLLAAGAALIVLAFVFSCASAGAGGGAERPAFLNAKQAEFDKTKLGDFARENLASFRTFTLKNGIPVIVKINPSNRIFHIRAVFRGGSALTTPANAGIETLMLETMARGSTAHPYEALTAELDATSSGIGPAAAFDSASYSLNTLDKYFDRVFPLWIETLSSPGFEQEQFDQVKENHLHALESKQQDPWALLAQQMNQKFFAGHPYAASTEGTLESIESLSLDDIKAWYGQFFSANRMFVVAVGNFDIEKLKKSLDASLGGFADRKVAVPAFTPFDSSKQPGGIFKFEYPQAKDIAYIRGDFVAPSPNDPAFMATNIAMKMYSDLLFDVVRSKHGAVYTPGATIRSFAANYGSVTLFKSNAPDVVKSYVDEALVPLSQGKSLATGSSGGAGSHVGAAAEESQATKLESIEDSLPVYKGQYVNEVYESQQTNAAIASQIQGSAVLYDDFRYYLMDIDRINAVTPADIKTAVDTYLLKNKITWGAIGAKDVLAKIPDAAYKPAAR